MQRLLQRREYQLAAIIVLVVGLITLRAPVFLSMGSIDTIVTDGAILTMMALVQMLAILTRGIDLSVSANMALTGMVAALVSKSHPEMAASTAILLSLGLGLLLGAINGVMIAYVGIPPIVVTLGTMSIYRGMVFQASGGAWVNAHQMGSAFIEFPTLRFLGLTSIVWIAAVLLVAGYLFFNHFRKGRELYALGSNPAAARYVGINSTHNQMLVYTLIGLVSGLCGFLWVARYAVAYTEIALGFELQTVAACVIGGVSMAGGRGTVLGCLLGSAFLVIIFNALPIINVSPFWQMAISGAVILLAVVLNSRSERTRTKLILKSAQLVAAGRAS
jgi:rhamnose transport system permease protein